MRKSILGETEKLYVLQIDDFPQDFIDSVADTVLNFS
jgi:hypothetical protein